MTLLLHAETHCICFRSLEDSLTYCDYCPLLHCGLLWTPSYHKSASFHKLTSRQNTRITPSLSQLSQATSHLTCWPMAPLTSPQGCNSCLHKSQITERCISNLHWIRNEELLLNSVVTLGAGPANSAELDLTIPLQVAGPLNAPVVDSTNSGPAFTDYAAVTSTIALTSPAPLPELSTQGPWLSLGAKPKTGIQGCCGYAFLHTKPESYSQ